MHIPLSHQPGFQYKKKTIFLSGFRSIISVLVEYDANMLLTDREGKTVYDYAHGNKKVRRKL
jgi:hypothetical protein